MKLKRFKVRNYRSIRLTPLMPFDNNLTIIGPNNEGKSNLVRALVTSLQLLEELADFPKRVGRARANYVFRTRIYEWERDCPLGLQGKEVAESEFKLEFDLDAEDQIEFYKTIGSSINNHLPITITVGREMRPRFEVNKPGKGYKSLTDKSSEIAAFIGSKLSINYIPAVRTANDSARSVEKLVSAALRKVEKTPAYIEAMRTIEDLQAPVLYELEEKLHTSLDKFVPSIKDVNLEIKEGRNSLMRRVGINIDDGQLTPLANKGDGIISLVGMALLSRIDALAVDGINLILSIEEPESHLHPRAIHNIRSILDDLGGEVQVIITTHSPALVNRINLSGNILVEKNKARVAESVAEIRDVLGVRVSDNLTNSRLTIICEGKNDQISLSRLLLDVAPQLQNAFDTGEIAFHPLLGGGNLSYLVSTIQNSICEPVCFLDDDQAGQDAFQIAEGDGLISTDDVVFTKRIGKAESEFEDLVCDDILNSVVREKYKADLTAIPKSAKAQKFSVRAKTALEMAGRPWNDGIKAALKAEINTRCSELGIEAIDKNRRGPIMSLAQIVSERIEVK